MDYRIAYFLRSAALLSVLSAPAMGQQDRIVGKDEPLYINGFGDDPAPLIFYLDRTAPPFKGKLGDAPPGYLIVPAEVWREHQGEALDLTPVYESTAGRPPVVLLRHGKALAGEY